MAVDSDFGGAGGWSTTGGRGGRRPVRRDLRIGNLRLADCAEPVTAGGKRVLLLHANRPVNVVCNRLTRGFRRLPVAGCHTDQWGRLPPGFRGPGHASVTQM